MNSYYSQSLEPEYLQQLQENYTIKQENSDEYFYNSSSCSDNAIGNNTTNNCGQQFEFNNFEQGLSKCGEIYINNGKLLFNCITCQQNFFNTFGQFYEHFQQFHFDRYNYIHAEQNLSSSNIINTPESLPCNDFLQNDQHIIPKTENNEFDEKNSATENDLQLEPLIIKEEDISFHDDSLELNLHQEKKSNNPRRNLASIGQRQFSCDICGKSFILKHHLTYHMTTHDKKPYTCDICDEKFLIKHLYLSHKRNHNSSIIKSSIPGKKPSPSYQCCVCLKYFLNSDVLMEHLNQHTTGPESIHNDLYTNDWTSSSNNSSNGDNKIRSNRRLRASGDRPFGCKVCSMAFKMKHHLKNHEETHKNYLD